jgi:hypothetical protein
MNLKELILKVSEETSLPASDIRKVTNAIFEVLRSNIEIGTNFDSPRIHIRAFTTKSSEKINEHGVKVFIPERKVGRLILKEPKY